MKFNKMTYYYYNLRVIMASFPRSKTTQFPTNIALLSQKKINSKGEEGREGEGRGGRERGKKEREGGGRERGRGAKEGREEGS